MSETKITESSRRSKNVLYIYSAVTETLAGMGAKSELISGKNRCELRICFDGAYKDMIFTELADKISDVIAVNYKYDYFNKNVKISGLKESEHELLLTALIAADIEEDKKYAQKRLRSFDEFAIDGIFNFRMKPLKEKWSEICGYIPQEFREGQLRDFIGYLIKDRSGKRVFYENGNVYDKKFNLLKRRELISDGDNLGVVKEILLSGAGEVELSGKVPEKDEKYLKEFYGEKVYFSENYFI